ncbi:MAG: DNA polymerase III subunit delta [Bacteroidales bacterium]|nr:DNA polymerase III subunit delta [Bacteroidales bacterium]
MAIPYASAPKKKAAGLTYETIVRDVRAGDIKPVYFLMGEEGYYIDRVSDYIIDTVLKPEEHDFNLLTFFGAETDIDTVITAAKGYPLTAERLVVVVREAQRLAKLDRLEFYLQRVQPSTVLIFCYKDGTIDCRLKVAGMIEKVGVLFDSKRLKDSQLPTFIGNYLKRRKVTVDPAAAEMMAEYVGSDLNRLASELDKLCIALPEGQKHISPELVERHVGISKDFNIFELQDALGKKDVLKVMLIANYFDKNPKANSIQKVLPMLFRYFTNVMLAYYAPEKTEHGIAAWLGQSDWQVRKNVLPAMKVYSGVKVMYILSEIRRTDARSKGVDNPDTPSGELMRELFYFILH